MESSSALVLITLTGIFYIVSMQDGHEICFVGDEAFRELSQVDPKAEQLITEVSQPF